MDEIEIMYRQLAPYIKNFFDRYSELWKVPFHDIYLTCRYKEGIDMDAPEAALVEAKCLKTDLVSNLDDLEKKPGEGTSEQTLLRQMFPIFKEEVIAQAKEWKCKYTDIYLLVYYERGQEPGADSLGLQLRTRTDKKLVRQV